jgi:hypothetical protein
MTAILAHSQPNTNKELRMFAGVRPRPRLTPWEMRDSQTAKHDEPLKKTLR